MDHGFIVIEVGGGFEDMVGVFINVAENLCGKVLEVLDIFVMPFASQVFQFVIAVAGELFKFVMSIVDNFFQFVIDGSGHKAHEREKDFPEEEQNFFNEAANPGGGFHFELWGIQVWGEIFEGFPFEIDM